VEASAIKRHVRLGGGVRTPTALLRVQSDERLITLIRRGNEAAFGALVSRYESRLLSFCRHLLRSREDAEDVLQDVFASAYKAMMADDRPIRVRPWLYRIARNRCLNHLRRISAIGVDSIEDHFTQHGPSTAETAQRREDLRVLVGDIQSLPESQRSALLLREMEALSYEQIAEVMDKTVPSVKSLLIRARRSLAESAEARSLPCIEARAEIAAVRAGVRERASRIVRRHVRACEHCAGLELPEASVEGARVWLPLAAPLLILKRLALWNLLHSARAGTTAVGAGSAAGAGTAAGVGTAALGTSAGAGFVTAGIGGLAGKAAVGLTAAAIGVAGAVVVDDGVRHPHQRPATTTSASIAVDRDGAASGDPSIAYAEAYDAASAQREAAAAQAKGARSRAQSGATPGAGTKTTTTTTTAVAAAPSPSATSTQPASAAQTKQADGGAATTMTVTASSGGAAPTGTPSTSATTGSGTVTAAADTGTGSTPAQTATTPAGLTPAVGSTTGPGAPGTTDTVASTTMPDSGQ
jgi:RNA polymerase sigma factor (sigma-70 family)